MYLWTYNGFCYDWLTCNDLCNGLWFAQLIYCACTCKDKQLHQHLAGIRAQVHTYSEALLMLYACQSSLGSNLCIHHTLCCSCNMQSIRCHSQEAKQNGAVLHKHLRIQVIRWLTPTLEFQVIPQDFDSPELFICCANDIEKKRKQWYWKEKKNYVGSEALPIKEKKSPRA